MPDTYTSATMQHQNISTSTSISDPTLQRYLNSISATSTSLNTSTPHITLNHAPAPLPNTVQYTQSLLYNNSATSKQSQPRTSFLAHAPPSPIHPDRLNTTLPLHTITRSLTDIPHSSQPYMPAQHHQPIQHSMSDSGDLGNDHDRAEISFVHDLIQKERITRKTEIDSLSSQLYKEREFNVKALNRERVAKENEMIQIRSMLTQQFDARLAAQRKDFESQLTEQYAQYERQLDELKQSSADKLAVAMDENHELERQVTDIKLELSKIKGVEQQLLDTQEKNVDLSDTAVKYESLQQTYTQLQQHYTALQHDMSMLQSDNTALHQQYTDMISLLQQSKECIDTRDTQLVEVINSNKAMSASNDQLVQQLAQLEGQRDTLYDQLANVVQRKNASKFLTYWRLCTRNKRSRTNHTDNNDHAIQLIHVVRQRAQISNALQAWRCAHRLRQQAKHTDELQDGLDALKHQFDQSGTALSSELNQQIAELKLQLAELERTTQKRLAEHGDTRPVTADSKARASFSQSPVLEPAMQPTKQMPEPTNQPVKQLIVQSHDEAQHKQVLKLQAKLQRERSKAMEIAMLWEKERVERLKQREMYDATIQQMQTQISALQTQAQQQRSIVTDDATLRYRSSSRKSSGTRHSKDGAIRSSHSSKHYKQSADTYYTDEMKQPIYEHVPVRDTNVHSGGSGADVNLNGFDVNNPTARDQLWLAYIAGQNTAQRNQLLLQLTAENTKLAAQQSPTLLHAMDRLTV